jgi:hypothetical protein
MNQYNDVMMKDYSSNNGNQSSNTSLIDSIPKIRVAVRKRPLNKKEIQRSEMDIIEIRGNNVIVKELK